MLVRRDQHVNKVRTVKLKSGCLVPEQGLRNSFGTPPRNSWPRCLVFRHLARKWRGAFPSSVDIRQKEVSEQWRTRSLGADTRS